MSHCEVKSLRCANSVLRGLIFADLTPWIVISRPWAVATTLSSCRTLVLCTKSPLLTISLHKGVTWVVVTGAGLYMGTVSFGEIVALRCANPIFRW